MNEVLKSENIVLIKKPIRVLRFTIYMFGRDTPSQNVYLYEFTSALINASSYQERFFLSKYPNFSV